MLEATDVVISGQSGHAEVAQTVFFSKNRFIIQTGEEDWFEPRSTPDRLEVAIFLKDVVPPSHLSCLHFLELVFLRLDPSFFVSGEPADIDFTETIQYVNDKLNFPKLTMRVCFRDELIPSDPHYIPEILASKYGREIQQAYFCILAPLVRLRRPHRFFVHVGWLDEECYSEDIADLERKLKQYVGKARGEMQCMVSAFESIWL